MADNVINVKLREAYDTEANWIAHNPILLLGQLAISSDKKGFYKVGNGTSTQTALNYCLPAKGDIGLGNVDNTADSAKNVLSATKFMTARTIALSGAAIGTATSFNGTANITIPVTSLDATKLSGTASISTTGNSATADKLKTARTLILGGDTSGSVSFDGSSNVTLSASVKTVEGTYSQHGGQQGPGYYGKNKVGFLMSYTSINNYTDFTNQIYMDNYNGNDVGGASAIGVARTAPRAFIMQSDSTRTDQNNTSELLSLYNYNSYTPTLTGTGASGTQGINVTGNSATTTKLQTARTINGVSFDGSANITVADNTKLPTTGGTLSGNLTIKKATTGSNSYGAATPTLSFNNADSSQNISLIYTDFDSVQSPSSLTLIGNQGGEYFIAPNIKSTGKFYGHLQGKADSATAADSASAVPWTGVTGRPTKLSEFENDKNYLTNADLFTPIVAIIPPNFTDTAPYSQEVSVYGVTMDTIMTAYSAVKKDTSIDTARAQNKMFGYVTAMEITGTNKVTLYCHNKKPNQLFEIKFNATTIDKTALDTMYYEPYTESVVNFNGDYSASTEQETLYVNATYNSTNESITFT